MMSMPEEGEAYAREMLAEAESLTESEEARRDIRQALEALQDH